MSTIVLTVGSFPLVDSVSPKSISTIDKKLQLSLALVVPLKLYWWMRMKNLVRRKLESMK